VSPATASARETYPTLFELAERRIEGLINKRKSKLAEAAHVER